MVLPKQIKEIVAENIRLARKRAGLSQEELAERAKISIRYVSLLETKHKNLSIESLDALARALGKSPCDLICNHGDVVKSRKAALKAAVEWQPWLDGKPLFFASTSGQYSRNGALS
jgi:transcriptional regulator with XRE-family HTH domain